MDADGPARITDPLVACQVRYELAQLTHEEHLRRTRAGQLETASERRDWQQEVEHWEARYQSAKEGETLLVERIRALEYTAEVLSDELRSARAALGEDATSTGATPGSVFRIANDRHRAKAFVEQIARLAESPTALCWLRALVELRPLAADVREGKEMPSRLTKPIGAALARGCASESIAVALDVTSATVSRARPKHLPQGALLEEIEERFRGLLLRGALRQGHRRFGDFSPSKRTLNLKTAPGADAGATVFRAGYAKGHR